MSQLFFFSLRGLWPGFIGNSLEFLSRETIKTFLWFCQRLKLGLRSLCPRLVCCHADRPQLQPHNGSLSYLSWLFSVQAETFYKSFPAQIWTPAEETTGLWPLWKTIMVELRSKDCCFGSTHLSRLTALNFNPIDNSLQTIVCSAGRTDCFWLLCGQNPRGTGIVCSTACA